MTTCYPAEFVLPGHPDKICDAIADALVQGATRRQRRALCGVEVAVHRRTVTVTGRIAGAGAEEIDVDAIVREVYRSAGYDACWYPAPEDLVVATDLCLGPLNEGEAEFRGVADDQSIVTGYAIDCPGTNYLPPEHWLAWRLARELELLRVVRPDLQLGPDGKVIVLLEQGEGLRLASLSVSLQQRLDSDCIELHRAVLGVAQRQLEEAAKSVPGLERTLPGDVVVNGAGNFAVGGPEGDNGLSGKKLVVDAYGPRVAIGGGALSGKDFFKADRAGAIIARRLAKAVVLTGAAHECTATLAWFPGDIEARLVSLRDGQGNDLDHERWSGLVDRSLASIGERFTGAADLVDVARHGHFSCDHLPWESIARL